MSEKLPVTRLIPMYNDIFKNLVREALLQYFNQEIQDSYCVSDWAQMSDGDWVIELKLTLDSWKKEQ